MSISISIFNIFRIWGKVLPTNILVLGSGFFAEVALLQIESVKLKDRNHLKSLGNFLKYFTSVKSIIYMEEKKLSLFEFFSAYITVADKPDVSAFPGR